jgi:hypothetical protein
MSAEFAKNRSSLRTSEVDMGSGLLTAPPWMALSTTGDMTSSDQAVYGMSARFRLPHRYIVVSLRDIASVQGKRLEIDGDRVAAHIRAVPGNEVRRRAGGRLPVEDLVVEAYHRRRQAREPFVSKSAEARAIISELHPAPPGFSTVRRHLSKLRRPKS